VAAIVPGHGKGVLLGVRDDDHIGAHGVSCEALPDGMTVQIDEHSPTSPMRSCTAARLTDDALLVPEPVIVVEMVSPTAKAHDAGAKLAGDFGLPSVSHYLLVRTERPTVIHHRRGDDGSIATRIVTAGALALDPPGPTLDLTQIYG
jgi:Uma2 family endonuclease